MPHIFITEAWGPRWTNCSVNINVDVKSYTITALFCNWTAHFWGRDRSYWRIHSAIYKTGCRNLRISRSASTNQEIASICMLRLIMGTNRAGLRCATELMCFGQWSRSAMAIISSTNLTMYGLSYTSQTWSIALTLLIDSQPDEYIIQMRVILRGMTMKNIRLFQEMGRRTDDKSLSTWAPHSYAPLSLMQMTNREAGYPQLFKVRDHERIWKYWLDSIKIRCNWITPLIVFRPKARCSHRRLRGLCTNGTWCEQSWQGGIRNRWCDVQMAIYQFRMGSVSSRPLALWSHDNAYLVFLKEFQVTGPKNSKCLFCFEEVDVRKVRRW
jgi:hypothetical protein